MSHLLKLSRLLKLILSKHPIQKFEILILHRHSFLKIMCSGEKFALRGSDIILPDHFLSKMIRTSFISS